MKTTQGTSLDFDLLRRDLGRIYGLGDFEAVDFEAIPRRGSSPRQLDLIIRVQEKRGGPFFLRTALNLDLDEDQNTSSGFVLNLTATRLNKLGLEWRTDAKIGDQQRLETELYQPFGPRGRFFVSVGAQERQDTFLAFDDGRQIAELKQQRRSALLDFGLNLGTYGELRVGALRQHYESKVETGPDLALPDIRVGGWRASLAMDRLDSIYFPREGQLAAAETLFAREEMGGEDSYTLAAFNHVGVTSIGRHSFFSWLEVGTSIGDDQPGYASFGGGGLFSFSGYQRGELTGRTYAVVRPTYLFRLSSLPPILGKGVYLGSWLEVGNFWESKDAASFDDLRYAGTLALGAETVIGPVYLAVGFAEGGRTQVSISIGPSFSARPR